MNESELIEKYTALVSSRFGEAVKVASQIKLNKGIAIADLLVSFSEPQCIEIKSDRDSLRRLETQIPVYVSTFKKTYILCGDRLLNRALSSTPEYVGVITVKHDKLVYHRKASKSPQFNHYEILNSLWKEELFKLAFEFGLGIYKSSTTKEMLILSIRKIPTKEKLYQRSIELMFERFYSLEKIIQYKT